MNLSLGSSGTLYTRSILPLADSGFMVSTGDSIGNQILIRVSHPGNVMWSKSYSGINISKFVGIDDETFYAIGGNTVSKLDTSGNILWSNIYSFNSSGFGFGSLTKNNGLVLLHWAPDSACLMMMGVIKIDSSGNLLWSVMVDSSVTLDEYGIVTVPRRDGTEYYVVAGEGYPEHPVPYPRYTALDEDGSFLWDYVFYSAYFRDIAVSDSSVYLVGTGAFRPFPNYNQNTTFVMRIDSTGVPVETWALDPNDTTVDLQPYSLHMQDNLLSIYAMFSIRHPSHTTPGFRCHIMLDTTGNIIWQKSLKTSPATANIWLNSSYILSDRTELLEGYDQPVANGAHYIRLIKTDGYGSSGCYDSTLNFSSDTVIFSYFNLQTWKQLACSYAVNPAGVITACDIVQHPICNNVGIEQPATFSSCCIIFPDPAEHYFQIDLGGNSNPVHIQVVNLVGQTVLTVNSYIESDVIDCSTLVAGNYHVLINGLPLQQQLIITNQ